MENSINNATIQGPTTSSWLIKKSLQREILNKKSR